MGGRVAVLVVRGKCMALGRGGGGCGRRLRGDPSVLGFMDQGGLVTVEIPGLTGAGVVTVVTVVAVIAVVGGIGLCEVFVTVDINGRRNRGHNVESDGGFNGTCIPGELTVGRAVRRTPTPQPNCETTLCSRPRVPPWSNSLGQGGMCHRQVPLMPWPAWGHRHAGRQAWGMEDWRQRDLPNDMGLVPLGCQQTNVPSPRVPLTSNPRPSYGQPHESLIAQVVNGVPSPCVPLPSSSSPSYPQPHLSVTQRAATHHPFSLSLSSMAPGGSNTKGPIKVRPSVVRIGGSRPGPYGVRHREVQNVTSTVSERACREEQRKLQAQYDGESLDDADRLRFNKVRDQADPEMPWNRTAAKYRRILAYLETLSQ
ncbi:hypothetical protein B0H16DRAFT_1474482 [Mycena metata]|uniref:Uncharacterized protein n=1 Tax=Mycena metata TaxID=1033252 RepID=A0AAD7MJB4_9AGAR|nr:hypothetical protein B0H16DRAFT_1474482 [Mycena metata]